MKRIIYHMVLMLSIVTLFLMSNEISFAQSATEPTIITESEQNFTDVQQQDSKSHGQQWWKTAYYTLYLKSIYCGSVYGALEYVSIKVNGKFVWGPMAMSTGTEDISIDAISVPSSARIEVYIGSTSSTSSAKRVGSPCKLKNYVDKGVVQSPPFKKGSKYTVYAEYTVTFEVKSDTAGITNKDFNAACYASVGGQVFEGEDIGDYQLGKWLNGVNVTLKGKGKTQKKKTNSRGYFFFYNLCSGKYTITFKKKGYYSAREKVTIYNDDDIGEGLFIPMSSR